jgi:HicA toxin of bacterial toxin-antitoxin,
VKGFGKAVREKLTEAGCRFVRHGRGDHDIWYSSISNQNLTVPVKIMSRHMANKVLKDAGLPKAF